MKFYFAPMEGITTYTYRNLHHKHYSGIEKYYAPFVSPGPDQGLSMKEVKDVLPEKNQDIPMVPQIMTNRSVDFIKACHVMQDLGYKELNFNLGCPSGTVVSKRKGSGFLAFPDDLNRFLEEVFNDPLIVNKEVEISIKTRAGKMNHEEWPKLMEIYNQYPMKELIIHPRVQQDFYKNTPSWEVFEHAVEVSKIPLVFNGDIFRVPEFLAFAEKFPQIDAIMLGRGIIRNPELAERIFALYDHVEKCTEDDVAGRIVKAGMIEVTGTISEAAITAAVPDVFDKNRFRAFHDDLIAEYSEIMYGEKPVLYKMKELWFYMMSMFPDCGKLEKKIKKTNRLGEYRTYMNELFG
ncbi:MAG: tRNA-dihydrouridine synthase family protein [Lachnospiraceae bacterium]|nr:tRNA-dihydrouridine synthase family protein [Lachnospiraceae bacterium]